MSQKVVIYDLRHASVCRHMYPRLALLCAEIQRITGCPRRR